MAAEVRWPCYAALIFIVTFEVFGTQPLRRFEYKYSFKPPYLAQKDGSVPFWEYGGSKFDTVTWFHITNMPDGIFCIIVIRNLKLCMSVFVLSYHCIFHGL
jgi:hypothetical protein